MQINLLNNILQSAVGTVNPTGGSITGGNLAGISGGNFTDIFGSLMNGADKTAAQSADTANALDGVQSFGNVGLPSSSGESFTDLFGDLVNNIKVTEAAAQTENQKILTGESDDIHTAMIAAQKAQIAVDLAVTVRDKVISAYNDVMNMQV